uniref:Uncharacterized protein KIAA1671 homolog isoform X2 n=1 Tax=Geotrypetes seraphini TaxID=260995 RepID=A0A6P8RZB5_GEOSA|nr:uncharacterized protein KIAA1671 homolog isoform X2 [Geotrypetes seraphini]
MATEVEVKSPLTTMTSLTDLSEITNERISQCTYIGPLSDASNKASELSNPPPLLIVEEKSRLGSALKPSIASTPGLRPRISPKPFKPSDSFEVRKIPITAPKQNSLIKSSLHGKPGQAAPDEELNGNAPSIDQNLNDADTRGNNIFRAKKIFYSMPETNSLTSGTEITGEQKPVDVTPRKECQSISQYEVIPTLSPVSQKSEVALYNEMSGSPRTNTGSVEPHRTGENKYSCTNDKSVTSEETSSAKVQLRTKHRPVSAVFLESLKDLDSQLENRGISEEVSLVYTADKLWVRKPRPLSVDLTAKFESKSTPPQKKTSHTSEETKENIPLLNSVNRFSQEKTKIISKDGGIQFKGKNESFKHSFKSNKQNDDFQLGEEKREVLSKDAAGLISVTTKELLINTLGESTSKWESKYKSDKEENERETDVLVDEHKLEKHKMAPNDTSKSIKERTLSNTTDIAPGFGEKPASIGRKEETKSPGGSIQRRISLLLAVSNSSPVSTEPASAEREKGNVDIQKRIKEFTAENVEAKPGSLRKSLRTRPLSADLTKMFSAETPTHEMKSQTVFELHTESPKEEQDKQENANEKNKEEKHGRTGLGDPLTEKIHWKKSQSANPQEKKDHFEKESFSREEKPFSLSNKNCLSKAISLDEEPSHAIPSESVDLRTVRATLFEHNIQRHGAVEPYFVVDTTPHLPSKTDKKSDSMDSSGLESLQRRNLEDKVHLNVAREPEQRIAYSHQNSRFYEAPHHNHSSLENLRERTSKYIEDTLNYQRIEPVYEVIQTIGERASSESITLAAEDKAVTLRSRKSSFRTPENETKKLIENLLHSDWSCSLPDAEAVDFRDVAPCSVPKNISETTTDKSGFTDPRHASVRTFAAQEDINNPVKLQNNQSMKRKKTSSFTYTDKQLGIARNKAMSTDNQGEKPEKPKVLECFSDNIVVKVHGVDASDSSDNIDKYVSSSNANKHLISGFEDSPSNDLFIDEQPRTGLRAVDKGESRMFGLKKYQELDRTRNDEDGTGVNKKREGKLEHIEVEGKVSEIGSTNTDLNISEQLGMMSIPDDASTHGKSKRSSQGITKSSFRRANFVQSTESAVSREHQKCLEPADSKESLKLQDRVPEPKATYFAVTCQVSNKRKDIFQCPLNQDDFMLSNQGKSESSRKNSQTFVSDKDISLETIGKNLDKRQDWETAHFSKQYLPNENPKPDEDYSGWRTLHKNQGNATKIDVDSLLKERISNSHAEDKILSDYEAYVRPSQKDGRELAWKKNDDTSGFVAELKDSYRYSVLDIDELMASYKPESLKASEIDSTQYEDQVHQRQFNTEQTRSLKNYADKHHSLNWKSQKDLKQPSSTFAETSNKPPNVKLDFSQGSNKKIDSFSQNVNKQNPKETHIGHRNWENLGDPAERSSEPLLETRDNRKRITKIADEEQVRDLSGVQQHNIKRKDDGLGSDQVSFQPDSDANLNSVSSLVTADSLLQKALSRKFQRTEKSVESSSQSNRDYSNEALKSKCSAIRTSDGNDFDKSKSSTEGSVGVIRSRPARVKDIAHLIQEGKEKRSEEKPKQSFHLETAEIGVKKRNSTRRERSSTDDKMDTENEWSRNDDQRSGIRETPSTALQRRSRSLKERREEPQPVDSCFYLKMSTVMQF